MAMSKTAKRRGALGTPHILPVRESMMAEEPIEMQIERLMKRMVVTVPFPISIEDAYFGCLPDQIRLWFDRGFFRGAPEPGKAGNLLLTMYSASFEQASAYTNPLQYPRVAHMTVGSKKDHELGYNQRETYKNMFWLMVPDGVPIPRNSQQTPFYVPQDHPHRKQIGEWFGAANELAIKCTHACRTVSRFAALVREAQVIAHVWPDLLNFISYRQTVRRAVKQSELQNVRDLMAQRKITPRDRKAATDMFAMATMLPEKIKEPVAWVGTYVIGTQ